MTRSSLTAIAIVLTLPAFAQAPSPPSHIPATTMFTEPQVYAGCSIPYGLSQNQQQKIDPSKGITLIGKVWYVDAINGKTPAAGGNGSRAAPWNSINGIVNFASTSGYSRPLLSTVPYSHVVAGKRVIVADQIGNPPVKPGDTILLMNGNYGDVVVGAFNTEIVNSEFVIFKPMPGQTPQFSSLAVSRAKKFVFDGIKIQSVSNPIGNYGKGLVTVSDQGASFPTSDIIFMNLDVSSADHATVMTWSLPQWLNQVRNGISFVGSAGNGSNGEPNTTCITSTRNHIHDVYQGQLLMANNSLVSYNEIDHFAADGIDIGANNIEISHNSEHDNQGIDSNHEDALQGQNGPRAAGIIFNKFSNIVIDSNLVIRRTDPDLQFSSYLQGFDFFDEEWSNMTITNNIIVSNSCHGMAISSTHDSLISHNTVVYDGTLPLANPGCPLLNMGIGGKTHEGPSSSNIKISNNLVDQLSFGSFGDTDITADNNMTNRPKGGFQYWDFTAGTQVWSAPVGTDANGNITPAALIPNTELFTTWDPLHFKYNMTQLSSSPAFGKAGATPGVN